MLDIYVYICILLKCIYTYVYVCIFIFLMIYSKVFKVCFKGISICLEKYLFFFCLFYWLNFFYEDIVFLNEL